VAERCSEKRGLLGRCKLESLHAGDHDNGKMTWPRQGADLEIYLHALDYIDRQRKERARLQGLADQHERGEL
jgi:hypothetical protein